MCSVGCAGRSTEPASPSRAASPRCDGSLPIRGAGPPGRTTWLAEAVGNIIDIALDRKPSAASEAIDSALEVNDDKPQPASPEWLPDEDEP